MLRYRQGWKALNRLLHEDRSFSGNERHCVFLNPGSVADQQTPRFADISAASGFDFPDDGRAVALTDWDFDGDLDVWVTNRTAPRIRFFKNNSDRSNHFLALKLRGDGKTTNLDAVGARVTVVLDGDESRPLLKTVTAGDAFLSQTSYWLHFGLGQAKSISSVTVRWPGGETEQYRNLAINERYLLQQHESHARKWTPPVDRKSIIASPQTPMPTSDVARTVLPARRLLPTIRAEGIETALNEQIVRPTLISIWSASCTSCIQELQEYSRHAQRVRAAGLDVIAVNLDNLQESQQDQAAKILDSINFPFTSVTGNLELVRSLDVLKRAIFDRWVTLSVPTSFLVDEQGFVCVVYQGPAPVNQVLDDLRLLDVPSDQLRGYSSSLRGRWIMPPPPADPLQVSARYVDEAMIKNGISYLERHAELLAKANTREVSQEPGDLYYVLALLLRDQDQVDDALEALRKAIAARPDDFRFRDEFATMLGRMRRFDEAAVQLEACLRINPQSVDTTRKLAMLRMAQGDHVAAIPWFKRVLAAQPNDLTCRYNLANSYRIEGQLDQAIKEYQQTLKLQPNMIFAANNLAWIRATHPNEAHRDGAEAVRLASHVCKLTRNSEPTLLDTLACAYAEAGEFDRAVETVQRAISIYEARNASEKAVQLKKKLELFREQLAFRDQSE